MKCDFDFCWVLTTSINPRVRVLQCTVLYEYGNCYWSRKYKYGSKFNRFNADRIVSGIYPLHYAPIVAVEFMQISAMQISVQNGRSS